MPFPACEFFYRSYVYSFFCNPSDILLLRVSVSAKWFCIKDGGVYLCYPSCFGVLWIELGSEWSIFSFSLSRQVLLRKKSFTHMECFLNYNKHYIFWDVLYKRTIIMNHRIIYSSVTNIYILRSILDKESIYVIT